MKASTNSVICKTWTAASAHPFNRMIYKAGGRGVANLVQVHPMFGDVVSNGENMFNDNSEDRSLPLVTLEVNNLKPLYFDHF